MVIRTTCVLIAGLLAIGLGCKSKQESGQEQMEGSSNTGTTAGKGGAGQEQKEIAVLTPDVAKVLEGVLKSSEIKGLLPAGWSLASANIEGQKVSLHMKGPGNKAAVVDLVSKDSKGLPFGKWFAMKTPDQPNELKAYAQAIDAAFEKSPWTVIETPKAPEPENEATQPPGPPKPGEGNVPLPLDEEGDKGQTGKPADQQPQAQQPPAPGPEGGNTPPPAPARPAPTPAPAK